MAKKPTPSKKKDNRLSILLGIAIVVIIAFTAIYFINQSQNDKKIEDSQQTSQSNQTSSGKASGNVDTKGLYGDYKPKYQATIDQLNDKNYQNIILPDDLKKKIDAGEGTFVYFFSPTCVHCQKVTPELMPLAQQADVQIDQYNVLEFEQGWTDYSLEGTPTLIYFKDGEEKGRIVGEQTDDVFNDFFKTMKQSS